MSTPQRRRPSVARGIAAVAAAAVVLVGIPTSPAEARLATEGSDGAGDPYWPLDGNGGTDAQHYDIAVAYDFLTRELTGTTTIDLLATEDLTTFNLDLLLPVTGVTVQGVPAEVGRPDPHEVTVTPAEPVTGGTTVKVEVTYAGRPDDYGYAGEEAWKADGQEAVAFGEPHMAPWWFPSNDHPSDKATFDISITGPESHQGIANGVLVDRTVGDGLATTRWHMRDPSTTYNAFFALGRFAIAEGSRAGRPWYVAVSRQLPKRTREDAMAALVRTPRITAWLEDRLGPYPFESTGGVATVHPYGALETQTRPVYTANMADPSTVAHEMTHQWFGNSVSLSRWRDVWLNEGFASFIDAAWSARTPHRSLREWFTLYFTIYESFPRFWQVAITDPGAELTFDGAVYDRGAFTLFALRSKVGGRTFWRILRTWAEEHRYAHATTEEFEQHAADVSGRRLGRFFDVWLRADHAPAQTRANGFPRDWEPVGND